MNIRLKDRVKQDWAKLTDQSKVGEKNEKKKRKTRKKGEKMKEKKTSRGKKKYAKNNDSV